MKKFLLIILSSAALASCTLYMDGGEPKDTDGDNRTESGDGFSAPHTDMTEDGTSTYQFNDGVHVYDETNARHVLAVDDSTVYFSESTPYEHMPQKGEVIYSGYTKVFPKGFMGEVALVTKENGMYKCQCRSTNLRRVFKTLKQKYSVDVGKYATVTNNAAEAPARQAPQLYAGGKARDMEHASNKVLDFSISTENIEKLPTSSTAKWFTKKGNFRGDIIFKVVHYIKVDYEVDILGEEAYTLCTDSTIFTIEGRGRGHMELNATLIAADDAMIESNAITIQLGSSPFFVYITPNVNVSLKGDIKGNAKLSKTIVSKKGFKKEGDYIDWIRESPEYDWKFDLGEELSADITLEPKFGIDIGITDFFKTVDIGVNPAISFPITFSFVRKNYEDLYFYYDKQPSLSAGMKLGVGLFAKIKFVNTWMWTYEIASKYFPWGTVCFTPSLGSLSVWPTSDGDGKEIPYKAKFMITDLDKAPDLAPMLNIYDESDMLVKQVAGFNEKVVGKNTKEFTAAFTLPANYTTNYYAMISYWHDGCQYMIKENTSFGQKIRMDLPHVVQSVGRFNRKTPKTPYLFEVLGKLLMNGGDKVSKWGLHCYLMNEKGKILIDKILSFNSDDGIKDFHITFMSKKEATYKMKLVPCYSTQFMIHNDFTEFADKAKTIDLYPNIGDHSSSDIDYDMNFNLK